jgi:hypothetical protein
VRRNRIRADVHYDKTIGDIHEKGTRKRPPKGIGWWLVVVVIIVVVILHRRNGKIVFGNELVEHE